MTKCIFFDRDDTIIVDQNYLKDPDLVILEPDAAKGMKALSEAGYKLVMITNQSGIGRGYFTVEDLKAVHARLAELLQAEGVTLDGIYFCPHSPSDNCYCRKPRTGMLEQADRDYHFDHASAAMIGDSKGDIGLAKAFGIKAIQVTYGKKAPIDGADFVCDTILDAANYILGQS